MNIPGNLKYTESNEWLGLDGNVATIGISDFAQDQLSDIVYAEIIVNEGDSVKKGETIATIESVKAAADVYSPVSGTVVGINEALAAGPEVINSDPYGAAWIIKLELGDPGEVDALLDGQSYEKLVESQQ